MRRALRTHLILLSVICSPGCKQRNESALKHESGKVSIKRHIPLKDCSEEKIEFPVTGQYLKAIANEIAQKNPLVFTEHFDFKNFCFDVDGKMKEINASANPANGMIRFTIPMLHAATEDDQVAGVMAHELAHVLMGHGVHRRFPSEPENDPIYNGMLKELEEAQIANGSAREELLSERTELLKIQSTKESERQIFGVKNSSELADLMAQIDNHPNNRSQEFMGLLNKFGLRLEGFTPSLTQEIKSLDQEIRKRTEVIKIIEMNVESKIQKIKTFLMENHGVSEDEFLNWTEEEADEVGYELYVRSGYAPKHYHFSSAANLRKQSGEGEDLVASCSKRRDDALKLPPRGSSTHPTPCYRLYNTRISESDLHKHEYDKIMGSTERPKKIVSPTLEEVLESLKEFSQR